MGPKMKTGANKAVVAVVALPSVVVAQKVESLQLNTLAPQPRKPLENLEISDEHPCIPVVAVVPVVAMPVARFADLAKVSQQALQKAITRGRLEFEVQVSEAGPNKGRKVYHVILESGFKLYPHAKDRYEQQQAQALTDAQKQQVVAAQVAARAQVIASGPLTGSSIAIARAWHCQRLERFMKETNEPRMQVARPLYIKAFELGTLSDLHVLAAPVTKLSDSTLYRWYSDYKKGGVPALEPQYKSNAQSALDRNPEIGKFVLGIMMDRPDLGMAVIHEMTTVQFGEEAPSVTAVRRYINRWKAANPEQLALRDNPDKHKSKYLPAHGSLSEDVKDLNDLWEADATKVDLIFSDDPRRYTLCAMVDVYSDRKAFLLVPNAGARDQIHLLRNCILAWGLPRALKTDNGKDYTALATDVALLRLEIEHVLCPPFRGDRKPHVERGFRVFLHDLLPGLPGFCGHSVADAQDIKARKTFAERLLKKGKDDTPVEAGIKKEDFEKFMNDWLVGDALRVRGKSSHLKGKSPRQMVDEWASDPLHYVRRIDPVVLDYVLLPGITKTVQKKGIQHNGQWFIFEFAASVGTAVEIRETEDIGRLLVFQGEIFWGVAENAAITGISREEVAVKQIIHHNARTKALRESTKGLRKNVNTQEALQATLHDRMTGASPVEVLQRAEMVQSINVAEAAKARAGEMLAKAKAKKPLPAIRAIGMSAEKIASIHAELAAQEIPPDEDAIDRYRRLSRATVVSLEDREWLAYFETTPRGRGVVGFMSDTKQA